MMPEKYFATSKSEERELHLSLMRAFWPVVCAADKHARSDTQTKP